MVIPARGLEELLGSVTARAAARGALNELAAAAGVQRSYTDTRGRSGDRPRRRPSRRRCGRSGTTWPSPARGAAEALRALAAERLGQTAEPVAVAWGRSPARIGVTVPAGASRVGWTVALEDGGELRGTERVERLPRTAAGCALPLPVLPHGYHHAHIEVGGQTATTLVLAAPRRAYAGPAGSWGVFLPLYAAPGPFGPGDFTRMRGLPRLDGRARRRPRGVDAAARRVPRPAVRAEPVPAGQPALLERALRRPGGGPRAGRGSAGATR